MVEGTVACLGRWFELWKSELAIPGIGLGPDHRNLEFVTAGGRLIDQQVSRRATKRIGEFTQQSNACFDVTVLEL